MSERGIDLRSMLTFMAIVITATVLLLMLGAGFLASIVGFGAFGFLILWFIYRYLQGMRGYQDRYTRSGKEAKNQQYLFRLGFLAIVFLLTFSYLQQVLQNIAIAFFITAVVYGVVVHVVDQYSGKLMREYVDHKQMRHSQFVNSISNVSGKCLSCQKQLDPEEQFCPHCGFEQRDIKQDSSYLKK